MVGFHDGKWEGRVVHKYELLGLRNLLYELFRIERIRSDLFWLTLPE